MKKNEITTADEAFKIWGTVLTKEKITDGFGYTIKLKTDRELTEEQISRIFVDAIPMLFNTTIQLP